MIKKRKGEISTSEIAWWVIGLGVLFLGIGLAIYLKGKGISFIDYFKNLAGSFGG